MRGEHPVYVFICIRSGRRVVSSDDDGIGEKAKYRPLYQMNSKACQRACKETGIPVRVHDLKHTFGRRLRAAGVSFEDRQDLLGHKSARITTHHPSAELRNLWEASNRVCEVNTRPSLIIMRSSQIGRAKVVQTFVRAIECAV